MLVRRDADGGLAIGQLSHAWVSGQLARAWGNERFPAPDPAEPIALGAEQHDIGWALVDLVPRLDPERGLPRDFMQSTVEEHLEIWRSAPERLLTQSEHAALVVSLHGRSLSELRMRAAGEHPALREHVETERARAALLCRRLGLSEEQARVIQRQMWTWDGLSLALCSAWDPFTAHEVPAREGPVELELRRRGDGVHVLDPWPFALRSLTVRCQARRLAGGSTEEVELREAFERAPLETLEFELAPAG